MKKTLTLVLVAATLFLTACSSISAGRITAKEIHPAYTWVQNICSGYNAQGVCTVYVPIFHNEPEKYSFDLEDGEKTGWVYVTKSEFDKYEIGDSYAESGQ